MIRIMLMLIIAVALIGLWLFLTWYHADQQPMFGPSEPGRVTFKAVIKAALHDVIEITRPMWLRAWLNAPFLATIAVDAASMLQPELREALFVHNPIGGAALIVLTLLARYGSTPAHAPIAPR